MGQPLPVLIISDSIAGPTGLGRISRELALRIHAHLPEFKIGCYGYGAPADPAIPVPQFEVERKSLYGTPNLPEVWTQFTGALDSPGVILSITNASWVPWLARPETIDDSPGNAALKSFLISGRDSGRLKRWLYFPVDADGPQGRLHPSQAEIILGFDRYLTYTRFASEVMDRTFAGHPDWSDQPTEYLPHGTGAVFHRRDRRIARHTFMYRLGGHHIGKMRPEGVLPKDVLLLAAIATNTRRKDWALCMEAIAELVHRGYDPYLWAHIDSFNGNWDLVTLAAEFDLTERVMFTSGMFTDEEMAWLYSGVDVTLCIGSSEGWGLSGAESLACQIPVVHGDYAGQTEFTPEWMLVSPAAFIYEGYYLNRRPVFRATDWANKVIDVWGKTCSLDSRFMWDGSDGCWGKWAEWLKAGL